MIIQLFGLLDMLAGVLLIFSRFGYSDNFMVGVGILMLIKSLVLFCGVVSFVDFIGAVMIIAIGMDYYVPTAVITLAFALWFLQKGFFSFVPS